VPGNHPSLAYFRSEEGGEWREPEDPEPDSCASCAPGLPEGTSPSKPGWISWSEFLQRVFGEDVLKCPRCRGRRHMISVITNPAVIGKMLASVRPRSEGVSRAPPGGRQNSWAGGGGAGKRIPVPPRQGRLELEQPLKGRDPERRAAPEGSREKRAARTLREGPG
jgi:hypothetical protein